MFWDDDHLLVPDGDIQNKNYHVDRRPSIEDILRRRNLKKNNDF